MFSSLEWQLINSSLSSFECSLEVFGKDVWREYVPVSSFLCRFVFYKYLNSEASLTKEYLMFGLISRARTIISEIIIIPQI